MYFVVDVYCLDGFNFEALAFELVVENRARVTARLPLEEEESDRKARAA